MTCLEIQNLLPAYLEDLLPPEENKSIKSHLASCISCSRSIEDLKRADDLVKDLEEVEPPPFFEQRIMARVREEAGQKKGFLRKFFFPLHIKIPIQAMATVLIVVLAFYVYQKNEPELKQSTPFPIPLTESGKEQSKAKTQKAPPVVAKPARRAPANDLPEHEQQRFAAAPPSENLGKTDKVKDSYTLKQEERPSVIKPGAPTLAAKEKEVPPVGTQVLGKAQGGVEMKEAGKALDALPLEQKRKGRMAETSAMAEKDQVMKSAPAASRLMAAPAKKRPASDITIQAKDAAIAVGEIEEHLGRTGGRIIEKLRREGGVFLKVEISTQKVENFLGRLETVGRVNLNINDYNFPEGKVTLSINIVTNP